MAVDAEADVPLVEGNEIATIPRPNPSFDYVHPSIPRVQDNDDDAHLRNRAMLGLLYIALLHLQATGM
jgi:hypothetical protein